MSKENTLPATSSVDDSDFLRVVTEEGDSKKITGINLKTYMGEGTATPYIDVVTVGDDKGLIVTEQLSVGEPSNNKSSSYGGGDSYGVGLEDTTPDGTPVAGSAWHCDTANTTDLVITSATDITTELSSDSGSTTALFGGTTTGKYILIGSEYTFGGVEAKIDTLGTVEAANIQGEYLSASSTWSTAPFMVADACCPYEQKGDVLSSCSSCSEQWFFGFNPLSLPVSWDKVTLNINGTDYTKYWARFRVTDTITLDPIIEQIKPHTNAFHIEADGTTSYRGASRYARSIPIERTHNADKNPSNEDIDIAPGITESVDDNEFVNGASDGIIVSGIIPEGLDTSIPVQVIVDWYVKGTGAGDIELEFETVKVGDGFVYDGTATTTAQTPSIVSVDDDNLVKKSSTFLVDISTGLPEERVYGSLFRDASAANTDDTFAGNLVIARVFLIGYFWRP